jgi:nudix-type nucleoside diphosphatase (YffH/AdpP family)
LAAPTILWRERLYEGYVTLERLRLRLPDGHELWREVENHGDGSAVLPYDPLRRVALTVRLHRAPVLAMGGTAPLQEACAGMIDPDETPDAAALREAMEELGVRLGDLEHIATVWTSPGVVAERVHLFLAPFSAADRVAAGGGLES